MSFMLTLKTQSHQVSFIVQFPGEQVLEPQVTCRVLVPGGDGVGG